MKKILVIDDDDFIRSLMVSMLSAEGYEVDEAEDGEKAIASLKTTSYDLVITDVVMPNKSGISVADHIRENDLPTPVLVVSAFSGNGKNGDVLEFANYFADETLPKPFQKDELLEVVSRLANGGSVRRGLENL